MPTLSGQSRGSGSRPGPGARRLGSEGRRTAFASLPAVGPGMSPGLSLSPRECTRLLTLGALDRQWAPTARPRVAHARGSPALGEAECSPGCGANPAQRPRVARSPLTPRPHRPGALTHPGAHAWPGFPPCTCALSRATMVPAGGAATPKTRRDGPWAVGWAWGGFRVPGVQLPFLCPAQPPSRRDGRQGGRGRLRRGFVVPSWGSPG